MRKIEQLAAPRRGLFVPNETALYVRPLNLSCEGISHSADVDDADRLLGGGPYRFQRVEIILRTNDHIRAFNGPIDNMRDWAVEDGCLEDIDAAIFRLTKRRGQLQGWSWSRPLVMGIVNVTPDSFSDRVDRTNPSLAISQAHSLMEAGADLLDIGGESTRPGSEGISSAEEMNRVVPVIEKCVGFGVPVSVDTSNAIVMGAAIAAGASIVNDVTALTGDPQSLGVVARAGVRVVMMHMQGVPKTMQGDPKYDCAPLDVIDYLEARIAACARVGLTDNDLIVDPGIGFGKTDRHNLAILARLGLLHGLGVPVMLGASRKSLIGRLSRHEGPEHRLGGSLGIAFSAVGQGVQILRVHDVAETNQALALRHAILHAE